MSQAHTVVVGAADSGHSVRPSRCSRLSSQFHSLSHSHSRFKHARTRSNGAGSMHDEANPIYVDMIDNTASGHRWLLDTFNVTPRTTWQVRASVVAQACNAVSAA